MPGSVVSIPHDRTALCAIAQGYTDSMGRAAKLKWEDLRFFAHIVQAKSLAGAARAMGVDHSTVGRRLLALERVLGAPLVIRGPDGLQLTPVGERIAPMVEDLASCVQAIEHAATRQSVRVRLALPTGFVKLFAGQLERLREQAPAVALEILSGARNVDIDKGEADLAVHTGPINDEHLIARPLGSLGWSLYASPAYLALRPPLTDLDDLSGHDLIGYDTALASLPAAQWVEQRSCRACIALRSREMTEMTAAAVNGAGLAMLPCLLGDSESGLVRLTPTVLATRDLSLVYRRDVRLAAPVRAAIVFVVSVLRQHADAIGGSVAH